MANRIKGITIEINGETKGLDKALSNITEKSVKVTSELRDVNKLLKLNPSSVELVAQKQELLSKQINITTGKLESLRKAQGQVEAQFKNGNLGEEQYRAFQREITATEGSLKGYKNELNNLKTQQSELGTNTQRLKNYFTATKTSIDDYSGVLGTKLVNSIKRGSASSDQMKTALQRIAKEAGISSQDLGKLDKALDDVGSSGQGIGEAKEKIDQLSRSSTNASRDVRKLGDEGQSSSGKFDRFKQAFSFGTVFSAAQSAFNTVTGGIGQLVSETVSASDSLEKFKGTMKFSGASDNEIKTVTKQVKKYADDTVYDLDTISSTTAQLASNGIKNYEGLVEAAGNLNAVAGGNQDTFKSVSMVMTQTAGAGKLTTENWNQLADAIPGASGKVQEALKKNGAYTGNFRDAMSQGQITSDEFNKAIMQLGNKPVAVEAAKSTDTFSSAVGNAQADIESAMMKILDQFGGSGGLSKAINELSKIVVKGLGQLKKIIQFVKDNQGAFKVLAAGVLSAVVAFKAMKVINSIADTFKQFNSITKIGTGVMKVFNATIGNNPYVKVAALVIGLVTALVLFLTKTKTGKKIVETVTNFIKDAWQKVSTFLKPVFDTIGKISKAVWDGLKDVVKNVVDGIKNMWNGFKDFMSNLWNGILAIVKPIWESFKTGMKPIVDAIKNLWDALKDYFTTLFDFWKTLFTNGWNGIKGIVSPIVQGISDFIKGVFDALSQFWQTTWQTYGPVLTAVWNVIKTVVQTAINVVKTVIETTMKVIKTIWDGIWNTFGSILSGVWSVISTTVSTAINVVADIIKAAVALIKGDWKGAWNAIKDIFKTIWDGIKDIVKTVTDTIKSVITTVWNAIKKVTSTVWNGIKSVIKTVWDGIKSVVTTVINAVKSVINKVWNNIKSITSNVWNGIKSVITNIWKGIKSGITNVVNGIKTFINNAWNKIKSITKSVWSGLKALMTNPVKSAKEVISGIVEKIKGFFRNMRLKIPKIQLPPMPHFSIHGSFSLKPPRVPSIGVRWYAKGAVFKKPALFNGPTGLSGAGEAGPEAMLPLNKSTLGMIGDQISKNMKGSGPINITVNVSGDEKNKEELAREIADSIETKLRASFNNQSTAFGGGSIA